MSDHRKFNPLREDDYMIKNNKECPGCQQKFKVGDEVTLVMIGPGDDEESREKCREGRPYNGVAIPAHYTCVTGLP